MIEHEPIPINPNKKDKDNEKVNHLAREIK